MGPASTGTSAGAIGLPARRGNGWGRWSPSSPGRSRWRFLLLGGDGPSVSAPIAVGGPPLRLAVGPETVWVTSAADGTLSGIDPETAGRCARQAASPRNGALPGWRSAPARSGLRARGAARSCASIPTPARVTARIDVGGRPGAIVFGGGRVWVADDAGDGVTAINAAGGRSLQARHRPRTWRRCASRSAPARSG